MAYTQHLKLSFEGSINDSGTGQAVEQWGCGLRSSTAMTPDQAGLAAAPLIQQWFTNPNSKIPSTATLDILRVQEIDALGKVVTSSLFDYTPNVAGVGGATLPPFVTAALSLETGQRPRGRLQRGRIFPPNYGVGFNGGNVANADIAPMLNAFKSLIDALNGAGVTIVVASKVDGTLNPVTAVSMDNILDTQRRRKNQLVPTRTVENL